jgi:hypothetical protein
MPCFVNAKRCNPSWVVYGRLNLRIQIYEIRSLSFVDGNGRNVDCAGHEFNAPLFGSEAITISSTREHSRHSLISVLPIILLYVGISSSPALCRCGRWEIIPGRNFVDSYCPVPRHCFHGFSGVVGDDSGSKFNDVSRSLCLTCQVFGGTFSISALIRPRPGHHGMN